MSEEDVVFGLIEHNARFYSPTLGRFTQPDTIIPNLTNSQGWNRYSYVLNSPMMYVDPSGHTPICLDGEQCYDPDSGSGARISSTTQSCYGIECDIPEKEETADENPENGDGKQGDPAYGVCERYYGVEACKGWNERFSYRYYWNDDNIDTYLMSFDIIFGIGNLILKGDQCAYELSASACDNPFWSLEDQSAVSGEYLALVIADRFDYSNPLMEFLLAEVGADPLKMANWDPAWIMAINVSVDASIIQRAKDTAFLYHHSKGYMVDWGNEHLDDIARHSTTMGGAE